MFDLKVIFQFKNKKEKENWQKNAVQTIWESESISSITAWKDYSSLITRMTTWHHFYNQFC